MLEDPDRLPPSVSRTAQLAERLGRDILTGKARAGDRLPTEQELIARFQVSRTVVREAMASLRAQGLIVSRQGAGVFVAGNATVQPFRIASDELHSLTEVENVLQLRLAVEVEAAGIAAERRTASDLCTSRTACNCWTSPSQAGRPRSSRIWHFIAPSRRRPATRILNASCTSLVR